MNYSKLIHDYLDEGLDGSHEDMLFERLAASPEARLDFNRQMKIHLLCRADMGNIAPPAAITNAVFANLGFSAPAPSAMTNPQNRFAAFMKRYGISILAGIVGLMIVGSGFRYFMTSGSGNDEFADNSGSKKINKVQLPPDSPENNSRIAVVSSYNTDASGNSSDNRSQIAGNSIRNTNLGNQSSTNGAPQAFRSGSSEAPGNPSNALGNQADAGAKDYDPKAARSLRLNPDSRNVNVTNPNQIGSLNNRMNNRLTGSIIKPQFLGNNDYSKPIITNWIITAYYVGTNDVNGDFRDISGISNSKNDFAVIGYYKLSDDWYVGGQIGRERFNQDFMTDGGKVHQRQSPELWYYGASMMYQWHNAFTVPNVVFPYANAFAGSNTVGFLSKMQVGISWGFLGFANMNFGAEYSYMLYPSDGNMFGNNLYSTQKFGFVAGVGIEF